MSKDRTTKTTVSTYPMDNDRLEVMKKEFKEDDVVFTLSEFLRFCLRSNTMVSLYKEKIKAGYKY